MKLQPQSVPPQLKRSMFPGKDILRLEEKKIQPRLRLVLILGRKHKKNFRVGEQNKEQRLSDIWLPLVAPSAHSLLLFCSVTLNRLPCSARWLLLKHPLRISRPPTHVCLSSKSASKAFLIKAGLIGHTSREHLPLRPSVHLTLRMHARPCGVRAYVPPNDAS